jgi:hypothetical protein
MRFLALAVTGLAFSQGSASGALTVQWDPSFENEVAAAAITPYVLQQFAPVSGDTSFSPDFPDSLHK